MNNFSNFFQKYGGSIIGGVIALIFACTGLYRIMIGIVFVVCGIWLGNYVQRNKEAVKEKLKNLIDKM